MTLGVIGQGSAPLSTLIPPILQKEASISKNQDGEHNELKSVAKDFSLQLPTKADRAPVGRFDNLMKLGLDGPPTRKILQNTRHLRKS